MSWCTPPMPRHITGGRSGRRRTSRRSEWQCSRVYAVLGRPEPALHHARRCLELCEQHGIGDWVLGFAYEALARAHAVAGDGAEDASNGSPWRQARRVAEEDDREHLLAVLAVDHSGPAADPLRCEVGPAPGPRQRSGLPLRARTAMPCSARGSGRTRARPRAPCARSKPRRELAAETPGIPGSIRSSEPWISRAASRRRARAAAGRGSTAPGRARASTVGSSAAAIPTAPPIEKPSSSVRGAPVSRTARPGILDAELEPLPRLDPVAHLRERRGPGKRGERRRTSHSSDARPVPATSPP